MNKVVNLYSEDKKINLSKDVPQKPVMVWGDRQLTGNIINNLLMNGIQSVPPERKPNINNFIKPPEVKVSRPNAQGVQFRCKEAG